MSAVIAAVVVDVMISLYYGASVCVFVCLCVCVFVCLCVQKLPQQITTVSPLYHNWAFTGHLQDIYWTFTGHLLYWYILLKVPSKFLYNHYNFPDKYVYLISITIHTKHQSIR